MAKIWLSRVVLNLIIGVYSGLFMNEYIQHNPEGASVCFGLAVVALLVRNESNEKCEHTSV